MTRVTPRQLDLWSAEMSGMYEHLEASIIGVVVNRLKSRGEVSFLDWQLRVMNDLHLLNEEVYRHLAQASGLSEKQISKYINDVGYASVDDIDDYMAKHMPLQPKPNDLNVLLKSYSDQTFIDIGNKVNQTLISTQYGMGPIAQNYNMIIDNVMGEFAIGSITLDQAIEKAILKWVSGNVAPVFIDKGGNSWSLERYVDMVMRSTLNRVYNEVRTSRMADYGITTVRMSELYDAAPRCAKCQGRVLDMRPTALNDSEYPSIYEFGYGTPMGTLGINCRHSIFPFIPGVNVDREPRYDPKEAIERSKVRDKQRELERRIRKTKKNIIVMEKLNSKSLGNYQQLLRKQQADVRNLLKDAPWLRRNYKREKVYTPTETLMKGSL